MNLVTAYTSLGLSLVALAAFGALFYRRWTWGGRPSATRADRGDDQAVRRWILVDALLLIAGLSMVTMSIHEIGHAMGNEDLALAMSLLALFMRGGLVAGGLALIVTFPKSLDEINV